VLGASPEAAWAAFVDHRLEICSEMGRAADIGTREEILSRFTRRDADDCIVLEAAVNGGCEQRYRVLQDHKDLPVIGRYELATASSREGLKAREIWFERFADVVSPGLPDPVRSLRFALEKRHPKHPLRTFVMSFPPEAAIARPACPECEKPCDRLVHLDLRRHPQSLDLPGTSLLMFTCSEHNWEGSWWHSEWRQPDEAGLLLPSFLDCADLIFSGPAVYDLDYEDSRVDRAAFDREVARWPAFDNSWEKPNFMFAVPGTKVGGAPSWIQGDITPEDSDGNPMQFVGQIGCYEIIEIGDSGEAYVFHSPVNGSTSVVTQCF